MFGIFITFSIMFLNAVFGGWMGESTLATAIANNDSFVLIDGLMMNNDSLITVVLMGLFISMFMNMIPPLIKTLFAIEVPQKFYDNTRNNINKTWANMKKWYGTLKK